MNTLEPATPETGPTAPASADPATAGFPLEEILDAALRAAYPARGDSASDGLPHETLVRCLKLPYDDDTADRLREHLTSRQALITRVLAEVAPRLYGYWQADEHARAVEHVDIVRDGQHVPRHTLRKWAVAADLVADRGEQRLIAAGTGARWLADQIRRELAHPADVPALAAEHFAPTDLFDRKRTEPTTSDDDDAATMPTTPELDRDAAAEGDRG